jgi:hypothetical protein
VACRRGNPTISRINLEYRSFNYQFSLARFLSAAEKDRLQEWEKFKSVDRNGRESYTIGHDAIAADSGRLNPTKRRPGIWRALLA